MTWSICKKTIISLLSLLDNSFSKCWNKLSSYANSRTASQVLDSWLYSAAVRIWDMQHLGIHWLIHWLPVQHRISYKIAILARDCIHGIGPAYFGDVCAPVTAAPGRTNLRSATRGDLVIPRTRTKLGERSFRISAPTVWNSLPDSLKHFATSREHFRKELKTYLFRKAYAPASENY